MGLITSPAGTAGPVQVTLTQFWLKDPLTPALNAVVRLELDQPKVKTIEQQTPFRPLGRVTAVVVSDSVIESPDFDLNFICKTDADWTALDALRATQHTLLLQADSGEQWYVRLGPEESRTTTRQGGSTVNQIRHVHLTAAVVDAP